MTVRYSVHNILKSYGELFAKAVKEKGNLEPYLQQLQRYDARDIAEHQASMDLSKDISVRALHTGMMKKLNKREIGRRISVFLSPEMTKSHGRAIFAEETKQCGLNVEIQDVTSDLWATCYELYIRTDQVCSTSLAKCIETKEHAFTRKMEAT